MFDVSVIIPNFNGALFLAQAIESALDQDGVKVEIIVVDDGSTDNSREVLQKYADWIEIFYQANQGAPSARNFGLKKAHAEYIKFLDADDVLVKNILNFQVALNDELNENQITYGQGLWVDEHLNETTHYPVREIEEGQDPLHHILTQNPLTSSVLHRRRLLEKINGFDEVLVKGQEFDLHLRLVLAGVEFVYYDKITYYFRQHTGPGRISGRNTFKKGVELFQMCQKQEELIVRKFTAVSPEVKHALAQRYWSFGRGVLRGGDPITARQFFDAAKRWDPYYAGEGFLYTLSSKFLGPVHTERLLNFIK